MLPEKPDIFLLHYGMPRRSGRYPWGSGENPYQGAGDFVSRVEEYRKQGMKEVDIAKEMGLNSTNELRPYYSAAMHIRKSYQIDQVRSMKSDGKSVSDISKATGLSPSTVRQYMNPEFKGKNDKARLAADKLEKMVDEKGMIDIGAGAEQVLQISSTQLQQAMVLMNADGYPIYGGGIRQVTNPKQQSNQTVVCPPGTEHSSIYQYDKVHSIEEFRANTSENGGIDIVPAFTYPKSMDASRIDIVWPEDGGAQKDGLIEIRRGVQDLSMGERRFCQARILVDGKYYVKGMAVYSDDLPPGKDIRFYTSKVKGVDPLYGKVLKDIKDDPDNPFGSAIKDAKKGGQLWYEDENGEKQLGLVNKRSDEGDWSEWTNALPSQFLSKQSTQLIKQQLDRQYQDKLDEFNDICELTNPVLKKQMLGEFADSCDGNAVSLKAAALPGQKYGVILPITSLKDNEIYAPQYKDGETLALIRYPHGGTFEIPIVHVNNKNVEAQRMMGNTPIDAFGINSKVASRLSGADFDGDTVMAIPCNSERTSTRIISKPPLKGLEDFDPHEEYREKPGMVYMKGTKPNGKKFDNTQTEMGKISNLISDMTLKGASEDELAAAVRHSMVVIDAAKHKLDYTQSFKDNNIAALKRTYQYRIDEDGNPHTGASTLISRAKSPKTVDRQVGSPYTDKETGEKIIKRVHEEYIGKDGKKHVRTDSVPLMSTVKDAHELSSGTIQEEYYADFANKMKALANTARKEVLSVRGNGYSAATALAYSDVVAELKAAVALNDLNAPREREVQRRANVIMKAKIESNPELKDNKKERMKIANQVQTKVREAVGSKRTKISLTDRQWEAIQLGAFTNTFLTSLFRYCDKDELKQRSMPNYGTGMISEAKQNKISRMKAQGYTIEQIAEACGVSNTTVNKYM